MNDNDLLDLLAPTSVVTVPYSETTFGEDLFKVLDGDNEIVKPMNHRSWIRGSAAAELCPREEIFAARHNQNRPREIGAAGHMYMGLGADWHKWVQKIAAKILVGTWMCKARPHRLAKACGYRTDVDRHPRIPFPDFSCPVCGAKKWVYVERTYRNKKLRLRGHPDGFRRITSDPNDDEILEFKTQQQWSWMSREEPWAHYMRQVQVYMLLTGLRRARIVLMNKAGSGEKPKGWFKEFTYGRDEHEIANIEKSIIELRAGLKNNSLTNRICVSRKCDRAKECPMVKRCFATEEGVINVY